MARTRLESRRAGQLLGEVRKNKNKRKTASKKTQDPLGGRVVARDSEEIEDFYSDGRGMRDGDGWRGFATAAVVLGGPKCRERRRMWL